MNHAELFALFHNVHMLFDHLVVVEINDVVIAQVVVPLAVLGLADHFVVLGKALVDALEQGAFGDVKIHGR
jgi:hypothetical protein